MNPLIGSSFCLRRIVVLLAALFITVVSAHAQTLTVLHSFMSAPDGLTPLGGVIMDPAGSLYGTTQDGGSEGKGTIFRVTPTFGGITETVLHSFLCCPPLGRNPVAGLILDGAGNLYGTAQNGGDQAQDGTVFKLSPSGTLTVLHEFNARSLVPSPSGLVGDGRNPQGTLLLDPSGNLYGTTLPGWHPGPGNRVQDRQRREL
jgi:uncharacterized repeat protein (TIGR03803 family)